MGQLVREEEIELPSPGSFLTKQLAGGPDEEGEGLMAVVSLELARVLRKGGAESAAAREFLPWLMERSVDVSLGLLSDLSLSVEGIMDILQAKGTSMAKGSRWKYLDYVVNVKMSTNPMHHSEFAIAMIDLWKTNTTATTQQVRMRMRMIPSKAGWKSSWRTPITTAPRRSSLP